MINHTTMILNGKEVAQYIYDDLKKQISILSSSPKLVVILIGSNPSSLRYIAQKQKWAEYVGIEFELRQFDENISQERLLKEIHLLNQDEKVHWYILQLPVPKHINEELLLAEIDPKKDVDGFHPENQGKIVVWDHTWLWACTPMWILELLKYYNIKMEWKNIVVIWRSNIVGKPITNLLINQWATVTSCNSKTQNIEFFTQNADIVITAIGVPWFLTLSKINKDTIVIDVGFTVKNNVIYGDCDFENIHKNGNMITPVPWWVGVLTVACLLKNVFLAYLSHQKKTKKNL